MSNRDDLSIQSTEEGLLISGAAFQENRTWKTRSLGNSRILLDEVPSPAGMMGDRGGFGLVDRNTYSSLLLGLVQQRFDGIISLDLDYSIKRLYFRSGELVFAGSNLMDDRLGEVIYRAGLISLDQLTEAAVQVTRTKKFGKVLLDDRVFTAARLWEALQLQVLNIFQSTFLHDRIYFQLDPGEHSASTSVGLNRATNELVDDCLGYAAMIGQFKQRLDEKVWVKRAEDIFEHLDIRSGTFMGDSIDMSIHHGNVLDYIKHSKLAEINTIGALFDMVHRNVLKLEGFDANHAGLDKGPRMKEIRSQIDAYQIVLDGGIKAFMAESMEFPVRDIELFLDRQYSYRRSPLFILSDGSLSPEAIISIYSRAQSSGRQHEYILKQLRSLNRFLLQIIGDLLPDGKGWEVKKSFQSVIS